MARTQTTQARALIVCLALLPLLAAVAEVRAEPQIVETPRPVDPPRPFDPPGPPSPLPPSPRPQEDEITFTPSARPLTLRAFNGFRADATKGRFTHQDHIHPGAVASFDSPWGERLEMRYWVTPHGISIEYDQDLKVNYRYDEDGTLKEIFAESPEGEALMAVGNRAELAYLGQRDFESFDLSAYLLIEQSLRAKHSDAFLEGLADFEASAEASCTTQGIQCIACVLGWTGSTAAIISACTVGGVPTMGFACAAAILAHEAAGFGCAATCAAWIEDCLQTRPPQDPPVQGCEL